MGRLLTVTSYTWYYSCIFLFYIHAENQTVLLFFLWPINEPHVCKMLVVYIWMTTGNQSKTYIYFTTLALTAQPGSTDWFSKAKIWGDFGLMLWRNQEFLEQNFPTTILQHAKAIISNLGHRKCTHSPSRLCDIHCKNVMYSSVMSGPSLIQYYV